MAKVISWTFSKESSQRKDSIMPNEKAKIAGNRRTQRNYRYEQQEELHYRYALCSCRQECLRFFPRAWKNCGQKPKLNQDEPANANSNANANANVLVDEICFVSQRFIEKFNMTENRTSKQGTG